MPITEFGAKLHKLVAVDVNWPAGDSVDHVMNIEVDVDKKAS
jgi:hypothetical protein